MARSKRILRRLHRWLGLVLAAQLLAWFASGLYFTWHPIEEIRGEHLLSDPAPVAPGDWPALVSPGRAWEAMRAELPADAVLRGLSVVEHDGAASWRVEAVSGGRTLVHLVDGQAGTLRPALTAAEAARLAEGLLLAPARPVSVEWVTEAAADSEIRGRTLPLWRVVFDEPEGLHLYLDPRSREVAAVRTERWRLFDFLWMFHIMDYGSRSDFGNPLLRVAAGSALVLLLTGLLYWWATRRRRRAAVARGPG